MTHQEIKAIIDDGEYCIKLLPEYIGDHRWTAFEKHICKRSGKTEYTIGFPIKKMEDLTYYFSPIMFYNSWQLNDTPEYKTVLTLDEWWSVMGEEGVTYTERTVKQEHPTAWQPKEGEMVLVSADGKEFTKHKYMGSIDGWYIVLGSNSGYPFGVKHIRKFQPPISVSLDDLKDAYAEKHSVDVANIVVAD